MVENNHIHCRVCGTDFKDALNACDGCGTNKAMLIQEIHLPAPFGPVNDYPKVLSKEHFDELTELTGEFFRDTNIPIVLTIVETTSPLEPPEYAFFLYNHWGIGEAGIDQGVLILLCIKEKHVESEIGFGLEEILPEQEGDKIVQEEFLPYFRDAKYYEGLKAGTTAIIEYLKKKR